MGFVPLAQAKDVCMLTNDPRRHLDAGTGIDEREAHPRRFVSCGEQRPSALRKRQRTGAQVRIDQADRDFFYILALGELRFA